LVYYTEGGTQAEGVQEVLRKNIWARRDKVTGELRRLYSKELYSLYPSSNINQQIKSRSMRWAWHVSHMRDRCIQGIWWEDLMERVHLEGLVVCGMILLKWIIKKWDGEGCTVLYWLRIGRGDGYL